MITNNYKTYIGLDVGERRIGVARINEMVAIAEPLELIETARDDDVKSIQKLIETHLADGLVVGLPRGLDGQDTDQTRYCRDYALKIKNEISVPVFLIDEAGTSIEAKQRLVKNSSISVDSIAASIILEDFVGHRNKAELEV